MAFVIPTLTDLVTRLRAAFQAELPGSDAFLWPNNVNPTTKVFGGGLSELFGRLDYVNRQARVVTAEGEWLDQHAFQYGMARRPPAPAAGPVLISAPDALTAATGARLLRSDGAAYAITADSSISAAGNLQVQVLATTPGKAGLAQPGTSLTLVAGSGFTGAGAAGATSIVDSDGITGGLDVEADGPFFTTDLSTLRGRVLFRLRNTPQGGAPSDYVLWASAVPGVTRVYVERRYAGPGTVRVFPLFDDLFPAQGGIPGAAQIAAVQAQLEALAPAGAAAIAAAPMPTLISPQVFGLTPNTAAVQEAVVDELRDTFRRLGSVSGSDYVVGSMPYLATPQTFSASWIWQAVANASGEQRHFLRAPSADVVIPAASIPVLGSVSFEVV